MKLPAFVYRAPESIEEAVAELEHHGDDSKVLAGGQSLLPIMALRLARPEVLVALDRTQGLSGIRREGEELVIGAMTKHRAVESDLVVSSVAPLLTEVMPLIGHRAIRSRGTLGGSIAHNDPAAELPAVTLLLGARMVASGSRGERSIVASDFFVSYLTTALDPDELLIEVRLPVARAGQGTAFREFSRRHGDFALVGVGAFVDTTSFPQSAELRLVFTGVDSVAVAFTRELDLDAPEAVSEMIDQTVGSLEPGSDLHASAHYRRHLARHLASDAVQAATVMARSS
jgi:CO/xanthine dehydrogenase FAD-binding subunit